MGSVYAFRDGDSNLFKFGKSKDPEKRFQGGRTFNRRLKQFDVIDVDDTYTSKCEAYLHKNLRTKRRSVMSRARSGPRLRPANNRWIARGWENP